MTDPSVPESLRERFEIFEALERGSIGPRFRAKDLSGGRSGVLVLVESDAIASASDRQRVRRELAKQATLSHPHIALPLASGEAGNLLYFFRDDVSGTTLRTRLARGGLQVSEAVALMSQIAAGLDELHRAGLLFRDLRPERVVIQDGGHVVLVEPGLAAAIDNEEVPGLQGTAEYVSPEQASGRLQSFRSDLYALGCVFHEMVAGEPPHTGTVEAVLEAHREGSPPPAPANLPEPLKQLHGQLLSRAPRQRPFSAQQVRHALNPFLPPELQSRDSAPPAQSSSVPKTTMLGMPAAGPARPPSMAPARPPSMNPSSPPDRPSQPSSPPSRRPGTTPLAEEGSGPTEGTQQVALADILEEKELSPSKAAASSIAMRPSSAPPAPPPSARPTSAPDAQSHPPRASRPSIPGDASSSQRLSSPIDRLAERFPSAMRVAEDAADVPAKSAETTQPIAAMDILDESPHPSSDPREPGIAAGVGSLEAFSDEPASHEIVSEAEVSEVVDGAYAERHASEHEPYDAGYDGAYEDDDGLDYDDLAETVAREGPSAFGSQNGAPSPYADAPSYGSSSGSYPAPDSRVALGAPPAQAQADEVPYAAPSVAQPAAPSRTELWIFLGGAMMLAAVCLFLGYKMVIHAEPDEEAMAAMAPPAAALPAEGEPAAANPGSPEPGLPAPVLPAPVLPAPGVGSDTSRATQTEPVTAAEIGEEERPSDQDAEGPELAEEPTPSPAATNAAAMNVAAMNVAAMNAAAMNAATSDNASTMSSASTIGTASTTNAEPAATTRSTMTTTPREPSSMGASSMTSEPSGGSAFDQAREQAREAFQARNFDVAAQLYQRATSINPRHAGSWAGLGAAQMQQRDYAGAVQSYQRAVTLSPRSSGFFTALGHAFRSKGDTSAARQAYQRALALNPNNASAQQAMQSL